MFRFKQFTVFQDNSAMKVCTDACLFGAVIRAESAQNALDIGTGTGLLSLMVAQRYPAIRIDAVEIDDGAIRDASLNFSLSPFYKQISLFHESIQRFANNRTECYDLIFVNPPFYEKQLKSENKEKNVAHHSLYLNVVELSVAINQLAAPGGSVWVLLPVAEMQNFKTEMKKSGFSPKYTVRVRHQEDKPVFREIVEFQRNFEGQSSVLEIFIHTNGEYSSIFTSYLKDYYLNL